MRRGLIFLLLMLLTGVVQAHGAGYEQDTDAEAVTVRFAYSIGETMAHMDVQLSSPDGEVHARGRTDSRGRYSFVPDRPGDWVLDTDDGMGHQVRAVLSVGSDGIVDAQGEARALPIPPALLLLLLAASLIANGIFTVFLIRR